MKHVYFDIENTLEVPFITGIQRVSREFSKLVLNQNNKFNCRYIPIIYDYKYGQWRRLDKAELKALLSDRPRSIDLVSRVIRRLRSLCRNTKRLHIEQFEKQAIFFDIDSSWHSQLERKHLLPALKLQGLEIVKLHYDIIPLLYPETSHPNTIKVFNKHFHSHLSNADMFLCISERTRKDVENYSQTVQLRSPKLTTIKLGGDIPNENSRPYPRKLKADLKRFGRYILSVGTIEPRKNHALLLDAYDELISNTDLNLVIVGKKGWLSNAVFERIHNHSSFESRIHHLDNISNYELSGLYHHAWVNVIPSLYEGFGLPLVEALSRECPTICSSAGSLPEIGGKHVLTFSPHSAIELSKILLSLYTNRDELSKLKRAAIDFEPVTWRQTAIDIDSLLSESFDKSRTNL